jgi:peroxiredoxin
VAPDFPASLLDGKRTSLRENLKPGRYLLLSFWASWCTPCIDELKGVSTQMATRPTLPLDILTVNVDTSDTASDVKPTLKMNNFRFPVVLDPKHEIFPRYHNEKTLPYSVLVNEKGEIVLSFNGYDESMFSQITMLITGIKHASN